MPKVEAVKKEIKVPSGVTVNHKDGELTVKGSKGTLKRTFVHPRVSLKAGKEAVTITCKGPSRAELGLTGTWESHVRNMFEGVTNGYQYKLRIIFSHFPIKTSVKGSELSIENFLGERYPRRALILEGVTVKISGDTITLEGSDKEKVGQTAANIEKATLVKDYDPRVFQDGIYLISRGD